MTDKHPNPTSLLELAAKVEAATGPDEGLWGLIVLATGCCKDTDPTASLDAAMTLVPGGVSRITLVRVNGRWGCYLDTDEGIIGSCDSAATRENALTAAALKARAHAD